MRYLIQGNRCIFSGVKGPQVFMSTVNAAELVIEAIADAEKINPRTMVFFDLRTSRGYRDLRAGQHELLELTVEYEGTKPHRVRGWTLAACPTETLQIFGVIAN